MPRLDVPAPPPPARRWKLGLAATVFTVIAVYGSFVPMEFKPLSWDKAVEQFKRVPYLSLGIYKRADFVANILLFIPLGFFWLGTIDYQRRSRAPAVIAIPFITAALVALAIAVEFAQQWTVRRTVSQNDIIAESVGAVIGIVLWLVAGHWLIHRMRDVAAAGEPVASPAEQNAVFVRRLRRFLMLYALGLVLYNAQPLDITFSGEAIREKMERGAILLTPFSKLRSNPVNGLWQAMSDVVLFIPIGLLLRLGRDRLRAMALVALGALLAAGLIELMQLFIFSRIVDMTDVVTSTFGGIVGGLAAPLVIRPARTPADGVSGVRLLSAALFNFVYGACLLFIFWHPHKLVDSFEQFRGKLRGLWILPFSSHYVGSEYHALVDVVRGVMYLVPIGAAWRIAWRGSEQSLWGGRLLVFITGLTLGLAIEVGQAAVVGRHADITDLCMNLLGACLGWWLWGLVFHRPRLLVQAAARPAAPQWN